MVIASPTFIDPSMNEGRAIPKFESKIGNVPLHEIEPFEFTVTDVFNVTGFVMPAMVRLPIAVILYLLPPDDVTFADVSLNVIFGFLSALSDS